MDDEERQTAWPEPPDCQFANAREVFQVQGASIVRSCGTSEQADQCFWRRIVWWVMCSFGDQRRATLTLRIHRSPDGTHMLAQSDDHHVDVFQLVGNDELVRLYSLRAPTTLLAMEWYPYARHDDPASWCFVMSARDVPTRLVDAYQGKVSDDDDSMWTLFPLTLSLPASRELATASLTTSSASLARRLWLSVWMGPGT